MSIYGGISWEIAFIPLKKVGALAVCLYLLFIMFAMFCVLNVIIGIFCQNAADTYHKDTDNVIEAQLADQDKTVEVLNKIFRGFHTAIPGVCSATEFEANVKEPRLRNLLHTCGCF